MDSFFDPITPDSNLEIIVDFKSCDFQRMYRLNIVLHLVVAFRLVDVVSHSVFRLLIEYLRADKFLPSRLKENLDFLFSKSLVKINPAIYN